MGTWYGNETVSCTEPARRSPGSSADFLTSAAIVPAMIIFCAGPAVADGLSLIGADNDSIDIVLPASADGRLVFHHTSDQGPEYDLDISTFLSDSGLAISVVLGSGNGDGQAATERLAFESGQHRAIVPLSVEELVSGVEYKGLLTASSPTDLQTWTVTIHQPRPRAEIDADANNLPLSVEIFRPFWFLASNNSFTVTLQEKSGNVPITGLTIRRAGASVASADFDIKRNLVFKLSGQEVDLSQWPVADATDSVRNIPAGASRPLEIFVRDLPRGEHKMTLQLDAVNAVPGSAPTIEIIAQVKHSVIWPVLLLIVAILLSFLLTKGIVNWRERLRLKAKTNSLKGDWLQDIGEVEQVVWLNATRKQSETVLERFSLLPAPQHLLQTLERATLLFDLLQAYRSQVIQLERCGFRYLLNWRMETKLGEILAKIEPDRLDDTTAVAIRTEFDNFEKSLGDPSAVYRQYVLRDRRRTNNMLTPQRLHTVLDRSGAEAAQAEALTGLCEMYIRAEPPEDSDTEQLLQIDRVSASCRVLLSYEDSRNDRVMNELIQAIAVKSVDDIRIDNVFLIANTEYWRQITEAVDAGHARILPSNKYPASTEVRPLVPARFAIDLGDERLNQSFMMKTRVLARWSFKLVREAQSKDEEKGKRHPIRWSRPAKGRSLLQFAPYAGSLAMSATLNFENQKSAPIVATLEIPDRKVSITSRLFALEEFVLLGLSSVIALASGIVLYYSSKPTFGALQDYLALFTWGVGVDQGKNVVQTFQDLRKKSGGSATDG